MQDVENLFLEVSRAIDERDILSAKKLLEEILLIDPGYGRAHNHLGWIYETKVKDFEKAQRHYELAIKFCNETYPVTYVNYGYLLIEFGQLDKATQIIEAGLQITGADKATLTYQKGKIAEYNSNYISAYNLYKTSTLLSFNNDFQAFLKNELARVQSKMNIWEKLQIRFLKFQ